jgi:hypothetical protein
LKKAVAEAKERWILQHCNHLNRGCVESGGTSGIWTTIKKIKAGLSKVKPSQQTQMSKKDGTKCSTPQENAEVFCQHFSTLYGREPTHCPSIINTLDQQPIKVEMDKIPTDKELKKAISQLNNLAVGNSGILAEIFKALATDKDTFDII